MKKQPNLIYVFADQHRYFATGFANNPNVKTPIMDELAKESVQFANTVSGCPVCSPYRATLMTGQYPTEHGVFVNDVCLFGNIEEDTVTIAKAYKDAGYNTAYIGKWHLDGHGRKSYIPKERRLDFDYWRVLECTHDYNNSVYYADDKEMKLWDGYDAKAQTDCAIEYLKNRDNSKPFMMMLSWGPPHNPYETAPQIFKDMYDIDNITLRANVPKDNEDRIKNDLIGYYAHISALDCCLGKLLDAIKKEGLYEDTIFIYTSDHGDMLGSQNQNRKQRPWDESILVPFLLRYGSSNVDNAKIVDVPFESVDIMPTLLDLCGIKIPNSVDGISFAKMVKNQGVVEKQGAILECVHPFGEFAKQNGGREYRGIRTKRYTYVVDLKGPWLLYDNLKDPYQLNNLVNIDEYKAIQNDLQKKLNSLLENRNDSFEIGMEYIKKWKYEVDETYTIPYTD